MKKSPLLLSALVSALLLTSGLAMAMEQVQADAQDHVYGSEIMTQQERNEFRTKMQSAKTAQEREKIRSEHHEDMKERAKERGVKLPDEPPVRGGGMGAGQGVGAGQGMGGGGGRNR